MAGDHSASRPDRTEPRSASLEWLCLSLVVLGALLLRLYRLGVFPDTFLADEADNAQDAVRILYGLVPQNGFFGLDWTSQPAFSAYKQAAFIALFGFNIPALRLSSALLTALSLIPFYLVLRRQFSMMASLLATVLLATEVWYLNFSRSGWNCSDVCLYMLMAMLLLMRGLDGVRGRVSPRWQVWANFAGAGLFCALGLYGYPAGRAITVAMAAFLPVAWLSRPGERRVILAGFIVMFLVEAALFAPQAIYSLRNWEHFNGRSNVVLIFNDPTYKADPGGVMLRQLTSNLRGPWDGSVNNTPQYSPGGEPQLSRVTGLLVLGGMLLALLLAKLRIQPETWLWWCMLLAGWATTQLLTRGTPNGARGIGYMPTLIYFAGAGLDGLFIGLRRLVEAAPRLAVLRRVGTSLLVLLVLVVGTANVAHYVDWQSAPRTRQARYLYVTAREFPDWAAEIVRRAQAKDGIMNVGQWRDAHPVANRADPYAASR